MSAENITVTDVVCPFCGSLCDDLEVEVEGGKIVKVKKACKLGKSKIIGHQRIESPMIRDGGELKEVSYDEAIEKASQILAGSKRSLSYGWASTSCEAIEKGVHLSEVAGGVLDSTASVCHGPTVLAVQGVGAPGCTLGEVKNRADIVVFWGCNPVHAHPRHHARYSYNTKGFFSGGKEDRTLIVFDVRRTKTADKADEFVQVEPGSDYKVFSAMRTILSGNEDVLPEKVGGVSKEKLIEIVEKMKKAKFGVIFGGLGITQSRCRYKNLENVTSLVDEINEHAKFTLVAMRGHYNIAGFGQVCSWETGYPFAVDFSHGYAWYNPGEATAVDVLNRKECDAVLAVAADPVSNFPRTSVEYMREVPVIQVDPYPNPTTEFADVVIPAAVAGVEAEGTAYRMDGIPIRMRKIVDTKFLSDEEIFDKILGRVIELKEGA
ncbi:MAG: formylmethanofuran dehydrogenase subunit B [Halobacteriota archaeon]|nr:formylmethanofuran dehydrogenase subunit B [Halobacteriota archaeon]